MATSSDSSTEDKWLGRGAYGSVYLHYDKQTDAWVAVKRIDVSAVEGKETKMVETAYKEISLMKDLINHKRMVRYIRAERESNIFSIYMEYLCGGSVKDELDKNGALSEDTTKKYTFQLLEGLSYIHGKGIIHRDVKGANILCDGSGNIKLADFGISRQMSQLHTSSSKYTAEKGTVYWMAPEVIQAEKYGRRADIWSTGATVVEMLTTQPPWYSFDHFPAMLKIGLLEKGGYVLGSSISNDAKEFLDITFTSEEQRPRADALLQHSWFKAVDESARLETSHPANDPSQQILARDSPQAPFTYDQIILNLPDTWIAPLDVYHEFAVVPGTLEYKDVENAFLSTLGANWQGIIEVKRVQNLQRYELYLIWRKDVAEKLGKQENQIETPALWYGTDVGTVSKITRGNRRCAVNFDRRSTYAPVYGQGAYFAKNSSYAAQQIYSKPDVNGHRYMIQSRVITGEWCVGKDGMIAAPYKSNTSIEQYDSVVDNQTAPTKFAVFHDAAAYPEYIIKFI